MKNLNAVLLALLGYAAVAVVRPAIAQTAPSNTWTFQMLDSTSTPVPGTLVIDLGSFTDGSLPSLTSQDIWGQVSNSVDSTDPLAISSYSSGFSGVSPVVDGTAFFTDAGAPWLGDTVNPNSSEPILLGTFDFNAFLSTLSADSTQHEAQIDFTVGASTADLSGDFDPAHPTITPGPPSLSVLARINPAGPSPQVPEPGTIAMLASSLAGAGLILRRRVR